MGTRLIPSLYAWMENDARPRPFIDILNRLEQLELLEDAGRWQFFRNLRNNLAHDYPESVVQTVETLNLVLQQLEEFIAIYTRLREAWTSRQGEPGSSGSD